jgi:hypothetical protein
MKAIAASLFVVGLALVACGKDNPYYCENAPDHNCANMTDGGQTVCSDHDDCASPTPICDQQVCVACTDGMTAQCTGQTPVCSNHTCVACVSHGECVSDVCLGDGSCAMPTDVAYVSSMGTGAACTKDSPCSLVQAAQGTLPYIRVMGTDTVAASDEIQLSRPVIIYGEGAKVDRTVDGRILAVSSGADAKIFDLEIGGATTTGGNAIELTGGKLALTRVRLAGNQGQGLLATGGILTMTQSTVARNDMGGVAITSNAVQFHITNNFFYRNGNDSSATVGGVSLNPPASGMMVFEFNTVVDNEVRSGSTFGGGVTCDLPTMIAPNNIVVRNFVNNVSNAANSNWMGTCTHPTSLVDVDISTLVFISPDNDSPFNYRIAPGSAAIDQATTTSSTAIDVDGDPRPQGGAKDIGADEYM